MRESSPNKESWEIQVRINILNLRRRKLPYEYRIQYLLIDSTLKITNFFKIPSLSIKIANDICDLSYFKALSVKGTVKFSKVSMNHHEFKYILPKVKHVTEIIWGGVRLPDKMFEYSLSDDIDYNITTMTVKYNDFDKCEKILHAFKETNVLFRLQYLRVHKLIYKDIKTRCDDFGYKLTKVMVLDS